MPYPQKRDIEFDCAIEGIVDGKLDVDAAASTVEGTLAAIKLLIDEIPPQKNTLVVNLFSGPGARKTTILHGLMNKLKWRNVQCEAAMEYAKDLIWEHRHDTFRDQIYLFGKMYHRIFRLLDQVSVVVTDCPILLTPIYDSHCRKSLTDLVLEEHNKMWTYNVFLNRSKDYDPVGRNQTEAEAKEIDRKVADFLDDNQISYEVFESFEGCESVIVDHILQLVGK